MTNINRDCCDATGKDGCYDLAVIGAGSAGFSASITAAERGAQVALIGHGTIGGTCVNTGCIPSKTLIRATESLHQAARISRFDGIKGHARIIDWQALVAQKDALVTRLRQTKYADLLPACNGVVYLDGPARLIRGGVAVNGQLIRADKIIITTGARPVIPDIPGIEDVSCLTSTTALELETLPESLLVIGGGVIGVELGQMFARAGVNVTICCRSRLLPGAEPEVSAALQIYLENEGIRVCAGISYQKIEQASEYVKLTCESLNCAAPDHCVTATAKTILTAQKLLVATGRKPNTEGLGLSKFGIGTDAQGAIYVDDRMRTSVPGIYAAGDVTGLNQFVYMAAYGAKLAAGNALTGDMHCYDATVMPSVVFTDPQVASVGLTEKAARDQGFEIRTSVLPLEYVPRALASRDTRGLIKLVAETGTDRLIGAHILAPEGGDSIQTAALAIKQGLTINDVAEMIFPYLTTVEGLKLAAQSFDKDVAMLSCCAG